jgi:hypothetical protein
MHYPPFKKVKIFAARHLKSNPYSFILGSEHGMSSGFFAAQHFFYVRSSIFLANAGAQSLE